MRGDIPEGVRYIGGTSLNFDPFLRVYHTAFFQKPLEAWNAGLARLTTLGDGTVDGGRGDFRAVETIVAGHVQRLRKAQEMLVKPTTARPHLDAIQVEPAEVSRDYAFPDLPGHSARDRGRVR